MVLDDFLLLFFRPFDPQYYEDEFEDEEMLDEEGRTRLKLKVSEETANKSTGLLGYCINRYCSICMMRGSCYFPVSSKLLFRPGRKHYSMEDAARWGWNRNPWKQCTDCEVVRWKVWGFICIRHISESQNHGNLASLCFKISMSSYISRAVNTELGLSIMKKEITMTKIHCRCNNVDKYIHLYTDFDTRP